MQLHVHGASCSWEVGHPHSPQMCALNADGGLVDRFLEEDVVGSSIDAGWLHATIHACFAGSFIIQGRRISGSGESLWNTSPLLWCACDSLSLVGHRLGNW